MQHVSSGIILADHPALVGHFPKNPVVPAVIILHHVEEALGKWRADLTMSKIHRAKFVAVLRPAEEFQIIFSNTNEINISFECWKAGGLQFATGEIVARSNHHA
ncbi:hypothetical protein L861_17225 [Litchfieldella anticariensis FP35 = DSM 16096]|uniref:ApeI dehydratase-like domain-containing protein n=1 Tax=Litchfieldella anticariensis (strain DSM 16096 / CECT 5854 / CIP 108499 / LMG 22089 / FP35) TaxID=1121939 RepID=S2L692_LITA3|nr:hypothetical protein L861_17225 [Halomonas anticariensis FP35 = DSM 16096]